MRKPISLTESLKLMFFPPLHVLLLHLFFSLPYARSSVRVRERLGKNSFLEVLLHHLFFSPMHERERERAIGKKNHSLETGNGISGVENLDYRKTG